MFELTKNTIYIRFKTMNLNKFGVIKSEKEVRAKQYINFLRIFQIDCERDAITRV